MFGGFRPPRFNDYYDDDYDDGYDGYYDDYYYDYDLDDWVNQLSDILNQRGRDRGRRQPRGGLRRRAPNEGGLGNIFAGIFGVQPRNNGPMRGGFRGRDYDRDHHRHRHHHHHHHRHQPRHRDTLGGQRRYNGRIGHVSVVKHHDRRDYARAYMARMAEYAGAILVEFNTYLGTLAEMDHLKRDYRRGTGGMTYNGLRGGPMVELNLRLTDIDQPNAFIAEPTLLLILCHEIGHVLNPLPYVGERGGGHGRHHDLCVLRIWKFALALMKRRERRAGYQLMGHLMYSYSFTPASQFEFLSRHQWRDYDFDQRYFNIFDAPEDYGHAHNWVDQSARPKFDQCIQEKDNKTIEKEKENNETVDRKKEDDPEWLEDILAVIDELEATETAEVLQAVEAANEKEREEQNKFEIGEERGRSESTRKSHSYTNHKGSSRHRSTSRSKDLKTGKPLIEFFKGLILHDSTKEEKRMDKKKGRKKENNGKEPAQPQDMNIWVCEHCTFLNTSKLPECSVCKLPPTSSVGG